ncbi:MAG: Ig-like domain-containing protein [Alphaproteobacteria bacterium]|nr:Ig-like domain-containing protein [Alphaproteobacteria bacterium]
MTKRSLALIGCLMFAAACPGDDPEPTASDTPPPSCATITSSFPAADATNVYYRVTLTWEFTEADTSTSATVSGPNGDVAGSGEWIGNTYIWQPSAPLQPSTNYTATLSYCDGANMPSTSFTTSAVGASVNLPDVENKTYALEIGQDSAAIFIEPPGVGPVLQQQLTDHNIDILIGVAAVDATNITLMGALGNGANPLGQDLCVPTIPFPQAAFSANPFFEVGPQDLTLDIAGAVFTLEDLQVNGAFAPDGSLIAGATLSGSIDTRDLIPIAAPGGDDDAVCELAAPFGVSCEACADNSGDYCLSALVTNISATQLTGLPLTERTEADVDADANCP